jgi:thiamine biosynthesis protein ThiS
MTGRSIRISLNGFDESVPVPITIKALIELHGEQGADLIVEKNNRFVFPHEYETTNMEEGDRVEFIHADFGG